MNRKIAVILALTACKPQYLPPNGSEFDGLAQSCAAGRSCNPIPVSGFPMTVKGDTRSQGEDVIDHYSCAPSTNEGGNEVWYAIAIPSAGRLTVNNNEISGDGIDVDVHLLSSQSSNDCLSRGDVTASAQVQPGVTYLVVDTYVKSTGAAQAGAYTVTVDFQPMTSSDCDTIDTDVAMRWTSCSSSVGDCYKSGSTYYLSTPTVGPVVKEAHLVTIEDGISGWPTSLHDRISTHYATSTAVTGYDMARDQPWAPAGEGGSAYGEGATGAKIPADAETFYINMNWKSRPAPGTPMIVSNPANGRAVVAAAGYETGPSDHEAVAGVSEEVHDWLGTDHMDDLQIGFAKDKTLPFGPIDCSGSTGGTQPPPPPSQTEACYLGKTRDGKTCDPTNPLPHADSDYDYPAPLSSQYAAPKRYLDLAAEDPNQYIAPNFQLSEIASEAKGQWAVVQTGAIKHLQNIRDAIGALVVTSGYRSPGYNAQIDGSASASRHMYGDGFDLEPVSASLSTLSSQCTKEGADYVSTYTDGHVHCDWRNDPLDPAFYGGSRAAPEWAEPDPIVADLVLQGAVFSAPAEGFDEGEPLRTWTAYDAAGEVLEIVEGETYSPPEGAAHITVDVGNRVVLERDL